MSGVVSRSAVFAAKAEVTEAVLLAPSTTSFIPLRPGYTFEGSVDSVTSDELTGDIGASKSFSTKQTPKGSLPKYLRASAVEGQAPEYSILLESAIGSKVVNATEYDTIAGSTAGSTSARAGLVVNTGEGAFFRKGQGVLIKDSVNNYRVRNVYSISSDTLSLNFNLPAAPALGVNLGKAVQYVPTAVSQPTFSAWLFQATSSSTLSEAIAGCRTTSTAMSFKANELAEVNFSFEGVKFYFDPLTVDATNNKVNFKDASLGSELTATITSQTYDSPVALAREIASQMDALTADTITVAYSNTTGKYTITSNGSFLSILWKTGTNGSDNTDTHIGTLIGFSDAANSTGGLTYTGALPISLSPSVTPAYDVADSVVVRNSEIVLGSFDEYLCRSISEATITINTPKTDILSICSSSGVDSSVISSREVTFTASLNYQAYEAGLFDKFINNTTTSVMINTGVKSGNNWVPGTVVNVYIPNLSLTVDSIGDDAGFFVAKIEGKGFVDSLQKDIYANFL